MNLELVMHNAAVRALGLTIFHSLWQAIIVFCLLQSLLFWLRQSAKRYLILYLGLCTVFAAFFYTFFEQLSIASSAPIAILAPSKTMLISNEAIGHSNYWWQSWVDIQHSSLFLRFLPLLTIGYALGIVLMGLRTGMAFRNVFQLRKQVIAPTPILVNQLQSLKQLMQIRKKIHVYVSTKVTVPAMLGFLKPIIVLPFAMVNQLDQQQLEAVLLHELSHIRRNDYLFNMLQMVMETLLFFNPMVWWMSAAIRKERELACDDKTLKYLGNPIPYAQALLLLEEARLPQPSPAMAFTGTNKKHFLFHRIKRITNMNNNKAKQPQSTMVAMATLMVALIMTGFFVARAQDIKKEDKAKREIEKTTTTHSTSKIRVKDDDGQVHTYETENSYEKASVEMAKALQEVEAELQQVDSKEIIASLEKAREALGSDVVRQAMKEAASEMEKVDWSELNKTVKQNLTEVHKVDWEAISKSLEEGLKSLDDINADRVEQAVEELKKAIEDMGITEEKTGFNRVALKKIKVETNAIAQTCSAQEVQVKKSSAIAKEAQNSAMEAYKRAQQEHKLAMKEHKIATKQSEKAIKIAERERLNTDKLLKELKDRNLVADMDNVHIEMRNDALYINGEKQSLGVYESVKHFAPPNAQSSLSIHNSKSQH